METYNLAAIRQRVRIDKLDDDEFDAGVIDRFINDTQRDIFNQFELSFMEKIFSGTIPAGSTMFQFPTDVAEIQSQIIIGPDTTRNIKNMYLDFRSFNERFPVPESNQVGPMGHWSLYSNTMLTSSPTDQNYTMRIFYIKKPTTLLEDAAVPDVPEEFSELLVLGALMRVQQRNEDYDLAAATSAEYQRQLNQMVARYSGRKIDQPFVMKNRQRSTPRFI